MARNSELQRRRLRRQERDEALARESEQEWARAMRLECMACRERPAEPGNRFCATCAMDGGPLAGVDPVR